MTPDQAFHEQAESYFKMDTLNSIGIRHQTDKASQFSRTYAQPHNYLVHLECFFEPLRYREIKLLEIGVGGGESIRTWLEYFPNARVFGVDIVFNTNSWNTHGTDIHDRYMFCHGNQSDPNWWKGFIKINGGDWDIVIDDGSHVSSDMKTTHFCLWPHLKPGGLYSIEDLNAAPEAKIWLEHLAGAIHGENSTLDSIYFAKELCVMRKK